MVRVNNQFKKEFEAQGIYKYEYYRGYENKGKGKKVQFVS